MKGIEDNALLGSIMCLIVPDLSAAERRMWNVYPSLDTRETHGEGSGFDILV